MIAFLAAAAGMKYPRFLVVTTLGAIPSVFIGAGLGHIALESSIYLALLIFVILLILLWLVMCYRDMIIAKVNNYLGGKSKSKTEVREYRVSKLNLPYIIFRISTFGKIKFVITERVERIVRPSIVLCNHGSFIDFAYAGTILKKAPTSS